MRKLVSYSFFFATEALVGFLTLGAAILFGPVGWAFFSLLTVLAFLKRRSPDERERHLLYKTGTWTLVAMYLSMFPVYFFLPSANWLMIMACSFVSLHGLLGLWIFSRG